MLEATRSRRNGIEHNGVVWRGIGPVSPRLPEMPEYSEYEATRGLTFGKVKLAEALLSRNRTVIAVLGAVCLVPFAAVEVAQYVMYVWSMPVAKAKYCVEFAGTLMIVSGDVLEGVAEAARAIFRYVVELFALLSIST